MDHINSSLMTDFAKKYKILELTINKLSSLGISVESATIFLFMFIFIFVVLLLIVFLGSLLGMSTTVLIVAASATAIALSTVISFKEPWVKTYRELHKEFWFEQNYAKVRRWLAQNKSYENELLPIIQKRLNDKDSVSIDEYNTIEIFDSFCALMLRVVYGDTKVLATDQENLLDKYGYSFWLSRIVKRHYSGCF